jgi:DNA (cytosine-5)-methyltransferase 1
MTHGSLFSGIGGFDLAAEWMGWENKFHCEWNEFGQKVLHYYWPKAELFTDITKSDFTKYANKIDILTGGFPCQPYSSAGKRLGKEDDRHLWPEMLRAIREISPRWVVGENVRGLTNWNGGLVFDEVQADLEAEGYEVLPFLLPACAVNAPHRRDRIWFVAYSNNSRTNIGLRTEREWSKNNNEWQGQPQSEYWKNGKYGNASNTSSMGLWHSSNTRKIQEKKIISKEKRNKSTLFFKTNDNGHKSNWQNFPTVSPICNGDDGLSNRLDNITFPKWRNESIKAGGNAIVPQVVYQIFKSIEQYERINNSEQDC